ncbi:MAG: 16S rRNA (cytosine(1402)-N(4))-methyltransferase, partial [Peptococcaceae bacterium]|nr:16S rRNA (cytosine(1402)-N(4))-methyltransferase [Peptococcaceae bacterium]
MEFKHIPVLFHEIMDIMAPQSGEVFVDCTLGGGGHSGGFLERISPDG